MKEEEKTDTWTPFLHRSPCLCLCFLLFRYFIRQRDYSKTITESPFLINYSGAIYRYGAKEEKRNIMTHDSMWVKSF